jgi:hypothetical protein
MLPTDIVEPELAGLLVPAPVFDLRSSTDPGWRISTGPSEVAVRPSCALTWLLRRAGRHHGWVAPRSVTQATDPLEISSTVDAPDSTPPVRVTSPTVGNRAVCSPEVSPS